MGATVAGPISASGAAPPPSGRAPRGDETVAPSGNRRTRRDSATRAYTPAYQWNPQSELMPPVPRPKPAIESTAWMDFRNFRFL